MATAPNPTPAPTPAPSTIPMLPPINHPSGEGGSHMVAGPGGTMIPAPGTYGSSTFDPTAQVAGYTWTDGQGYIPTDRMQTSASGGSYIGGMTPTLPTQDMSFMWGGNSNTGGGDPFSNPAASTVPTAAPVGMMGPPPTPAPAPAAAAQSQPAAASGPTGMMGAEPTAAPAGDYTAQAAALYSSILGRQGDAEGVNFWANQLASGKSLADVTASFRESARTVLNNYLTTGQNPYADLLDQDLQGGATPGSFTGRRYDNARAGLTQNVFDNLYGTQPTPEPLPVTPQTPYGQMQQQQAPNVNRRIDAATETIEGRINNLMAQDQMGNYTNPVVRQAVDRAMQSFASRGLLNTSMAVQAGQEAAIAKAIEIAGPDAERYFQQGRANQDAQNVFARDETQQSYTERNNIAEWAQQDKSQASDQAFRERILNQEQAFTLRQNYIEANDNANARFNAAINNINASNMTPEDKSVAIAQAQAVRDGDLTYNNNLFAAQPGFAREWLAIAAPTRGMDVNTITNLDTLANIANDPAQPESVREAARVRLASINAGATDATTAAGEFPSAIKGVPVKWDQPLMFGSSTLRKEYNAYRMGGGLMTPAEWYTARQVGLQESVGGTGA